MKRSRVLTAGLLIGGLLVACTPLFADDAELQFESLGPLVEVSWVEATATEATIVEYRIDVEGVEIDRIDAPATACVITGLDPSTTYDISVTAYDSEGRWSGSAPESLEESRSVDGEWTTPATGDAGSVMSCVDPSDSDGDRLPDAVETGPGPWVSAGDTGTSPHDTDTDDDGLTDGEEVLGTLAGLDLYGMGTRPGRPDILFEYDWFVDSNDCGSHSHRPTPAVADRVEAAFDAAPVSNPDGSTGINAIQDYGQGGLMTGGNQIADADGVIAGGVNGSQFGTYKNNNFAANREGYFHYVLMPHRYNTTSGSSGQAEIHGDDLIVSLQCFLSTSNVGNTIVHEVGHNLGLRHGGNEDRNYKPNYNSVMNYEFQFPGVDVDCSYVGGLGDGVLDLSSGDRPPLNENALFEAQGLCGGAGPALDWDGDGVLDVGPVAVELNGDAVLTTLNDFDDWSNISLESVDDGSDGAPFGPHSHNEVITEQPVPEHAR